ncbi:MAG: superfamily II DNA or RNA helicase [Verrucomicrobiales bacterium]|jgi:superfamily II DNA or RNA helicase
MAKAPPTTANARISKKSAKLTLHDRLSRLSLIKAEKLLGDQGKVLIREGGKFEVDPVSDVTFDKDKFELRLAGQGASVTIQLEDSERARFAIKCSRCQHRCEHQGATLAFILEEKMLLGLAAPPIERVPVESLSEKELVEMALAERRERALLESMRLKTADKSTPWTDYTVTSAASGKTYRVALRGTEPGQSFCSCPDFRKNTLGTCKHILYAQSRVKTKFNEKKRYQAYKPDQHYLFLTYGKALELCLESPENRSGNAKALVEPFLGKGHSSAAAVRKLITALRKLEMLGEDVTIYPDAEEFIARVLHQDRVAKRMAKVRADRDTHALREDLLRATLLPYQLDGIAFATGAGRAILADDMGLGKTIQGIGVAEMLARETGIKRVLVVCPASVKSQWQGEIQRFSDRSSQIVLGTAEERAALYQQPAFFTICNYEQILRDQAVIEHATWDLIILDEAQRIKNWEAKTTAAIKSLRSPYALVLTGTPLENRIDELYSIIGFLDDRRLGPAFRFFNRHRVVDEKGKVLGYKNLTELRKSLEPVLLRRTRQTVLSELPERTTEIVRIAPTAEQADFDHGQMQIVSQIVSKKYLTEIDLMRLQKALLLARMNANSTFLVNREEPSYSTKLEFLRELLESLCAEEDRKIVLFSEWTRMLDLIEVQLNELGIKFVRLDGSISQKKRPILVDTFQSDPECQVFITTNAGSTGLNLQAANTVINVDLPWNPALLEQRIGRAHRMGQKRPVHVYILVTEETLEERLLGTLTAKRELSLAVLDPDSNIDEVSMESGMEELRRRLEILLGAEPAAAVDESTKQEALSETAALQARKTRVAEAGGQMLSAAFAFLSEMLPDQPEKPENTATTNVIRESLSQCLQTDESGKPVLTVTLPNTEALDKLAQTLAKLIPQG